MQQQAIAPNSAKPRERILVGLFSMSPLKKIILVAEVATRVGVVHHVRVLGSPDGLNGLIEQRTMSKILDQII
jgi:hypothetical protein